MPKKIEEKIGYCKRCDRQNVFQRSSNAMGLGMMIIHMALTIITGGLWLIALALILFMNIRVGGWVCSSCGNGSKRKTA